jgi:hypothetical protein
VEHSPVDEAIIQMISRSQSQIGGGRPGEHGRTNCGCILIMLCHTPRKCQRIISVSIEWNRHLIPLVARFGTLGLFPFGLRQRKADEISRWNSIWTSCSYSGYSGGKPAADFEHSFSRMDGAIAKCVQVDGEYVGWVKRTQYIEIHFNREIRLCCIWRGTPYRSLICRKITSEKEIPRFRVPR